MELPELEPAERSSDLDIITPKERISDVDQQRKRLRSEYEAIRDRFYADYSKSSYQNIPQSRINELQDAFNRWQKQVERIKKQSTHKKNIQPGFLEEPL